MKSFKDHVEKAFSEWKVPEPAKGKATIHNVDFMSFKDAEDDLKSMRIKVVKKKRGTNDYGDRSTIATLSGSKKDLFLYLTSADYGMSDRDVLDLYPELFESMGTSRQSGNKEALADHRLRLRRLVKIFDQVEGKMSHIDTKAVDQAKAINKVGKAIDDLDNALSDIWKVAKRNT